MDITTSLKASETNNEWYVVDATDVPLGRLSSQIAMVLRGKHKPNFTPHVDNGDHVVVINAEKVRLTGHKRDNMEFHYHTGFAGGLKTILAGAELDGKHPERVVERAVKRMLPKWSALSRKMYKKLHVYAGTEHPHTAQQPKTMTIKGAK
ncbi:MAG: 50S ribosomal protein L13 [Pseudomonadaceae bacterium]|nr:50S ribosomal protein L13 [Pseudomonadaceae bacterium]